MISLDSISRFGIGTWGIAGYLYFDETVDTERQLNALKIAFDLGANYVDCSLKYADGASLDVIKELIRYAGRENLFISVKLEKYVEDKDDVSKQLNEYLEQLNINMVDVLQLHAPSFTKIGIEATYQEIARLISLNTVRYAGASNFSVAQLKQAIAGNGGSLAIHESLLNFSFRQNEDAGVLDFCNENGIRFIAYQPLHRGKTEALGNELLLDLAQKYSKSQPQIILNWLTHKGIIPMVRSDNIDHLRDSLTAGDFVMSDVDYDLIDDFRDGAANNIAVDWDDGGQGNSIYQIANK